MRGARKLGRTDDLIGDQYIVDAGVHQYPSLTGFLAAHTHRTECNLTQRHRWRLVHLGVRTQTQLAGARKIGHASKIALERIKINDQGGRIDLVDGHANGGWCGPMRMWGVWSGHGGVESVVVVQLSRGSALARSGAVVKPPPQC